MVNMKGLISLVLVTCWSLVGQSQPLSLEKISAGDFPIHEVSQDSSGTIWLATGQGIYSWSPLKGALPISDEQNPSLDVRSIHHMASGAWVLTTGGLLRLADDQSLVPHGLRDLRQNRIVDLVVDQDGNTWFLGLTQLFLLKNDRTQAVWTLAELGVRYPVELCIHDGKATLRSGDQQVILNTTGREASEFLSWPAFNTDIISPDGALQFNIEGTRLVASLVDYPDRKREIFALESLPQVFQDNSGNIWLASGSSEVEVFTAESFGHLASSMLLEQNLRLQPQEEILAVDGNDHRAAVFTSFGTLIWCNRLTARRRWQLDRKATAKVSLTSQHILIRNDEEVTIVSLNSEQAVTIQIPGLTHLSSSEDMVTFGLQEEIYLPLTSEKLDTLMEHSNPVEFLGRQSDVFDRLFARDVLFLPGGEVVALSEQELSFYEASSRDSASRVVLRRFDEVVHWRSDSILGLTENGSLMLMTLDTTMQLTQATDFRVRNMVVAPERNLIWLREDDVIWRSEGISGLHNSSLAVISHFSPEHQMVAWDRVLLTGTSAQGLSLLISEESKQPAGELFISCVRWGECLDPWQGYRLIPLDSTVFTIEFESTILTQLFDQLVEVRINDQPWQLAEDARFTFSQLNTGEYEISARLRGGGQILIEKEQMLQFSLRSPYYQSWWFVFIGLVMLAGLIWAGLTLYYGENERKRLELQVRDRTKDLDRFVHELKQKNEDLEQFAYIASHDLKSPLRGVIGHLQLFLRKYQDNIEQPGKDSINYAITESKRLYEMVNDLLDFASVGSGKMDKKLLAMNRLLESVRQSILLQRRDQQGEIILGEFPQIHAVPSQFETLFRNLIENGLKFNESDRPSVTISYEGTEDLHLFRVKDNGIGMNQEYIEKAFELYGRLNPDYPGTGIGLAICRRVVERHGGILSLDKSDDTGSVFLISLPKVEGEILA